VNPLLFLACSVCYGDPASQLSKGAVAGALFMIGVVAFVLTGFALFALRLTLRSRKSP
jgi:hypothetical protein